MSKAIDKSYLLTQLKNFDSVILQKEFIQKFDTMPALGESTLPEGLYVGQIVEFVGALSTSSFRRGFFYEIKINSESGVYEWSQINVQPQVDPGQIIDDIEASTTTVYSSSKVETELAKKVDIDQNIENAGKILKVDATGNVDVADADEYSITKLETAETGYFASYQLAKNGTEFGTKINIPKDFLVKSASIETCTTPDVPVAGYVPGDKYIDFVINAKEDPEETPTHLYLKVTELIDVYTAAPDATEVQIAISDQNVISATLVNGGVTKAKLEATLSAEITAATTAITTLNGDVTTAGSVLKSIKDNAKDATYDDETTIAEAIAAAAESGLVKSVANTDDVTLIVSAAGQLTATLNYETTNIDFENEWDS